MANKKKKPVTKKQPAAKPNTKIVPEPVNAGANTDFGFEIQDKTKKIDSVVQKQTDDGATIVEAGGSYGTYLDLEGTVKNEAELITRYREMALQPEIESAIDDIMNEFVAYDEKADLVSINLDQIEDIGESVKETIRDEFSQILTLFDFNNSAYEIARRWYIDGRLIYQLLIDVQKPTEGIQELRYIDPRKIKKVREVVQQKAKPGVVAPVIKEKREYWIYNETGFAAKGMNTQGYQASSIGIKISNDSIIHATSGLMDPTNRMVLGWLHKASKPLNQLRDMEDAAVIYRLVRAPERRIFYIDVGNLPKAKAEQFMRDQMVRHKNKIVYDASTGTIKDDRKFLNMLEDYWLPRRNGSASTEVTTLAGGSNLGDMTDVSYFQKRLYRSLNVPISRQQDESTGFNLGRSSEITRDELKFSKFISRLRLRFSKLFKAALEKQLILKNIITPEEAPAFFQKIAFDFKQDNHFTEFKNLEIQRERLGTLSAVDPFVGKYYSLEWVKKHILNQDAEEIDALKKQMKKEEPEIMKFAMMQAGLDPSMQQQDGGIAAPPPGQQDNPQFKGQGLPGGPDGPKPK